ncbi:MAG: cellulase family glycosylhydrolase [Acidimicrobiales bacterium]|jgi:endoglycosylceramidase
MRRCLIIICMLLAVTCSACTSASSTPAKVVPPAAPTGFIGHQGRWLIDSEGRVLLPHGVNDVVKQAPFDPLNGFDAADASLLAAHGFRAVRLGVLFDALMPQPGKINETYLHEIDRMADLLAQDHIFVLLDMHQDEYGPVTGGDGFPAWATITDGAANPKLAFPTGYFKSPAVQTVWANFWADRPGPGGVGLQERYVAALVALAETFKSDRSILGYDIMNEPWPGADYESCETEAGCPTLDQRLLAPFYTKAARAIRAVDPHHLIFVEPFLTFDYEGSTSIPAFGSPANALSFHPYIAQFPGQTEKAITLSAGNGDALLATEFGATTDVSTIDQFLDGFDSYQIPWLFWDYSMIANQHGSSGETDEQASAALRALARPYPFAVAGVPTGYSFDTASREFRFSYSSHGIDGKPLAGDTVTDVITPSITYPDGYLVSVDGATVTSHRCAPMLTLRATAPSVTVVVRPGGGCG